MVMASRLKGTGWLVEGQNKYQMKAAALAISPLLGMNMIDMRLTHPGLDEGCLAIFGMNMMNVVKKMKTMVMLKKRKMMTMTNDNG